MLAKLKELDKKKTSLIILGVLIVISIVLILSKMTAAYLEPDEDDITETNGVVTAAGDRLIFTKGNDISISANQDNFGTGDGNLTATTNPKATLIANTKTNSATTTYYAGIIIYNNTFVKTTSSAELILTVTDPSGNVVTTSSDSLNYVTVNGVSGFDVTGLTGAFNIVTNQAISTTSSTTGTTQTWTFTLTFVNLSTDQSANETAIFSANAVIQEKEIPTATLYSVLADAATVGTYAKTYTGSHNDSLAGSGSNAIYYWYASSDANATAILDKNNVIFGGFCWQMLRTTDTGGVKLIYNGEVVDDKCESTRADHTGVVGASGSTTTLSGNYVYGNSYTISGSTFTLTDTESATWSATTYENLIGKYTCGTTSSSCTTLYYVNGYKSATEAYTSSYTVGTTNYAQIGTSPFNANRYSPAMVGYMFNKVINNAANSAATSGSLFGSDVSYSNGTYTLTGTSETKDATHHYTCNNTTGTCSVVRYYYISDYYVELSGEENISAALTQMLSANDVNKYDSNIKSQVERWYRDNLSDYTSYLEDAVYCNDRTISNETANGWYANGGNLTTILKFKNYSNNSDLSCTNVTDQFSVGNTLAQTKYPVGLATLAEMYLLNNANLRTTGATFWLGSPYNFGFNDAIERFVSAGGGLGSNIVSHGDGVRAAVSLASGAVALSGDGSQEYPYVIN